MGLNRYCRDIKVPTQSYYGYEQGDRDPPLRVVTKIAETTGCSLSWLLVGIGDPFEARHAAEGAETYARTLPILATASAADYGCHVAYQDHSDLGELDLPESLHAIRVVGDSMLPLALEGQYVLVVDKEPAEGDLAVVDLRDEDEVLFKRVSFPIKTRVILTSVNPDPRYQVPRLVSRSEIRRMRRIWGLRF